MEKTTTPKFAVKPLFPLGQIVATQGVLRLDVDTVPLLTRHAHGDFGDCCGEDVMSNRDAIKKGGRVFSVYTVQGTKVWIITEANRSSTCLLLPEEY